MNETNEMTDSEWDWSELLSSHLRMRTTDTGWVPCECGKSEGKSYVEHLARVAADHQLSTTADAWDDGAKAMAVTMTAHTPLPENPYRSVGGAV